MKLKAALAMCLCVLALASCGKTEGSSSSVAEGTLKVNTEVTTETVAAATEETTAETTGETTTDVKKTEAKDVTEKVTTTAKAKATSKETTTVTIKQTKTETAPTPVAATTAAKAGNVASNPGTAASIFYKGQNYSLNDITNPIALFGKTTIPVQSVQSCHGDGQDILYQYKTFSVSLYKPKSGASRLTDIDVTGADITTPKGLRVGMTVADAKKILGSTLIYTDKNGTITGISEDNKVISEFIIGVE